MALRISNLDPGPCDARLRFESGLSLVPDTLEIVEMLAVESTLQRLNGTSEQRVDNPTAASPLLFSRAFFKLKRFVSFCAEREKKGLVDARN